VLLAFVFFEFVVNNDKLYACLPKHLDGVLVGVVAFLADNPFDACVDYHHGAGSTRRHFAVKRGALQWYAETRRLDDGVLFRVQGADAVLADFVVSSDDFAHVMSDVVAVRQPRGGTHVACGHDAFVFDDDAACFAAVAGGAFGNRFAEV
jgi:hypothetical protein